MANKLKLAQQEIDLDRSRRSESEVSSKLQSIQNELKNEKHKRQGIETELESRRRDSVRLQSEVDTLKSNNKLLVDKNLELN